MRPGIVGTLVFAIAAQADGRLWFGTKAGLYLREQDGRVRALHWNSNADDSRVTGILHDRDGGYWLSAPGLLRRREPSLADDVVKSLSQPIPVPGSGTQRILGMLQDHEGSIWFATKNGGLAQLVPQALRFAGRSSTTRTIPHRSVRASPKRSRALAMAGSGWSVAAVRSIASTRPPVRSNTGRRSNSNTSTCGR